MKESVKWLTKKETVLCSRLAHCGQWFPWICNVNNIRKSENMKRYSFWDTISGKCWFIDLFLMNFGKFWVVCHLLIKIRFSIQKSPAIDVVVVVVSFFSFFWTMQLMLLLLMHLSLSLFLYPPPPRPPQIAALKPHKKIYSIFKVLLSNYKIIYIF